MPPFSGQFVSGCCEVALRLLVLLVVAYLCESVIARLVEGHPVNLEDPPVILPAVLLAVLLAMPLEMS